MYAGFAISSGYHKNNPLVMAPGETREIQFGRLQNPEETDKIYKIELVDGEEIAILIGEDFDMFVVPAGTMGIAVNLRISIPENFNDMDEYIVSIKFSEITSSNDEEKMITFITSTTKSMPVLINSLLSREKESSKYSGLKYVWIREHILWIIFSILIIFIVLIIYFLYKFIKRDKF